MPVHGDGRPRRSRRRRGRGHRLLDAVRADRRRARGAPSPDRVPARAHPLLGPVGEGRRRPQRHDLRDQRRPGPPRHRRGSVLSRHRRRHHPSAAASGRLHQPGHRIAPPRREERARQAARVHRGPRRHRRPVHRQDRHPHRRPHQLRAGDRPVRQRQHRRAHARPGVQRGHSDRGHGRGRQPTRRRTLGSTWRSDQPDRRIPAGRHRPLRSRTALRVGARGPRRPTAPHHQGRSRNGPRSLYERRRRRASGARRRVQRRQPRGRHRQPDGPRADHARRPTTNTT